MDTTPKPSEIVIMVSGAVALISAFLAWQDVDTGFGSVTSNVFDDGFFPLATYIPLIGLLMGLQVALAKFANVSFPERILGFDWTQIHLILGIFAGLLALGWLITDVPEKGIGLWLGVLASIGLVVGAVMQHMAEGETSTAPGSAPPQPF